MGRIRSGRFGRPRWQAALATAVSLASASVAAVIAEDAWQAQLRHTRAAQALAELETAFRVLKADLTEDAPLTDGVRHAQEDRADAQQLVSTLAAAAARHPEVPEIAALVPEGRAVIEELDREIAAAQQGDAHRGPPSHHSELLPAMRRLRRDATRLLEQQRERARADAGQAQRSFIGTFAVGFAVLVMLGTLLVRRTRRAAQAAQEHAVDARVRALLEESNDLPLIVEADGRISWATRAALTVLGRDPEELVGTPLVELAVPEHRAELARALGQAGRHTMCRFAARGADGSLRELEAVLVDRSQDPDVAGILVTLRDITARAGLERQLLWQAQHDTMTELPNRSLFLEHLDNALNRRPRLEPPPAVLYLDLDGFKQLNDELGHAAGDAALREIARRLRDACRPADVVARLGGDEFAVLMRSVPELDPAVLLAERLRRAIERPLSVSEVPAGISVSVGIAAAGPDDRSPDRLVAAAADAMSAAKAHHSPYEVAAVAEDAVRSTGLARTYELRETIAGGERIVAHFQPIIDLHTGRVRSIEALARWMHPEHGLLPPSEFVELAEQTGLIRELTDRMLTHSLEAAATTAGRGHPLAVAVNVSATVLRDDAFVIRVERLLEHHGIRPEHLRLEITESELMRDPARTLPTIAGLDALGVALSIDDFGTGHSSLTRLRTLPITELKIDRSFVAEMNDDASAAMIVRSTIGLAHDLSLRVVAEGVEDAETQHELTRLGCHEAQGYLFGRPMPLDELLSWLDDWERERASAIAAAAAREPGPAHDVLARTSEQFSALFAHSGSAMALLGLDGRYLQVNDAACELLGRPRAELLTMRYQEVTHPEQRESDDDVVRRLLDGTVPTERIDKRYLLPDGSVRRAETVVTLVRDEHGHPSHLLSLIREIGDRRRAQALEHPIAAILETFGDAVCTTDLDRRILSWNGGAERLFGIAAERVLGRPVGDIDPLGRSGFPEVLDRARRGSVARDRIVVADAHGERTIEVVATPTLDERDTVTGVWAVSRERTMPAAEGDLLRRSGEVQRRLLDVVEEGVYGLDRQGVVTFANDAAHELLGWPGQELVGRRMHDEIHHSRPDATPYPASECPIHQVLNDGQPTSVEGEAFWRRDGSAMPVRYRASPIVENGGVTGVVVAFSPCEPVGSLPLPGPASARTLT